MDFPGFLGNTHIKDALNQADARLSHAYLLAGAKGSGKRALARIMAAAMMCEGARLPCLECGGCRKVFSGSHPDVSFLDSPSYTVDIIRGLRVDAFIRPNEGKCRVFIIAEAHNMNAAAQNAMLNILEEPPGDARFILTSALPELLLPTIRSRVQMLRTRPLTAVETLRALGELRPEADGGKLRRAAERSGGILGAALELIDGGGSYDAGALAAAVAAGDELAAFRECSALERLGRAELKASLIAVREAIAGDYRALSTGGISAFGLSGKRALAMCGLADELIYDCERNIGALYITARLAAGFFDRPK